MVSVSEERYKAIRAYASEHGIEPLDQGTQCPWYQGGKCAVYIVRPLVCHLFGHTEELLCSRGYNVNINDQKAYDALRKFGGAPTHYLHEILEEKKPGYVLADNLPEFLIRQRDATREGLAKARKHQKRP